jgi:O-acetyl-ADP-ribose deacetylase (regulator of RNase III)
MLNFFFCLQAGELLDEYINDQMMEYPLPPTSCVLTPGFGLRVKHLILAVAPAYHYNEDASELMQQTYHNVLLMAMDKGASSISLPSLGTGGMGFPIAEASKIAMTAFRRFLLLYPDYTPVIRIVCFEVSVFESFSSAFSSVEDGYEVPLR